jgi:hypothetical protein
MLLLLLRMAVAAMLCCHFRAACIWLRSLAVCHHAEVFTLASACKIIFVQNSVLHLHGLTAAAADVTAACSPPLPAGCCRLRPSACTPAARAAVQQV